MYVRCPHCSAYTRVTAALTASHCTACTREFVPTRGQVRRAWAEVRAERLREARQPLNLAGSIAIFAVTVLLLLAMYRGTGPLSGLAGISFWLFPAWVFFLIATSALICKLDTTCSLALIRKSAAVTLALLVLPLAYDLLTPDRAAPPEARVKRPAPAVVQVEPVCTSRL